MLLLARRLRRSGDGRLFALRIAYRGKPIRVLVRSYSDLHVLREIFVERDYELESGEKPETILDLGANAGLSVLFFSARYPEATIIAVEPDPNAFELLVENTRQLSRVRLLNVAVAKEDGRRRFFPSGESWTSSFRRTSDSRPPIEVEARSLESLLEEFGTNEVGLVKVDVEGAEEEVLAASAALGRVRAIVGEIHLDLVETPPEDLLGELAEFQVEVDRSVHNRWRFKGVRTAPKQAGISETLT